MGSFRNDELKRLWLKIINLCVDREVAERKNEAFRGQKLHREKLQSPRGSWLG
jgi:hypothetical protein